ncbi:MAG: BAX inhibitor (BI)-1/YccA family protein, partial [Muribaculaceae bacterium]|nr:BAX inhibitor (BI)-1/YccA family protein [Muribaculaceae bacterium]
MNYNSYPPEYVPADFTARVSSTMKRVYVNMTLALVVTAFVSLWCSSSQAFMQFVLVNRWAMWGLLIAELGLVLGISAGINKL